MALPPKNLQAHVFNGGLNSDDANELMPANQMRYALNVRSYTFGERGVITNIAGNLLVETALPGGTNIPMGWAADEQNNLFYFIVYNSNGYHTVYYYNELTNTVSVLLQSITDSGGVDILMLNPNYLINHVDVIPGINGTLLTWVDGYNKALKFNTKKALDKSSTGYGLIIQRDFVVAYKKAPVMSPVCNYFSDNTRTSNFLYGKLFKFALRFIYDDGEKSNWSDYSLPALPPNQTYSGINNITYDNNCIQLLIETGNQLVIKLELAMMVGSLNFVSTAIIDKAPLGIQSDSHYIFSFYNDGADSATDQNKIIRTYSYLPDKPFTQAFVKNAMTYGNFYEGFDSIDVNINIGISYQDIFLPDGTANQLNSPEFITSLITNGYSSGSVGINKRYNVQQSFTVGFDVKKGNKFYIYGQNGGSANFSYSVTASAVDDATTIANKIKAWQRSIGRGLPTGNNGISNESIDGSGNVTWGYTILGYWNESPIKWSTSVTPVSFATLQDDGTSTNLIKPGSSRCYAVRYWDDDYRKSNAYTNSKCVANTEFITQTGDLKQAVHAISIFNAPPLWARYYDLLRTPDSGPFIQMLIQYVIQVDPDPSLVEAGNSQKYLDLVVGSLFTYQKLHPNTILVYDFEAGDRLRLIKYYDQTNANAPVLYPYLETEVLSYSINTVELVNENISLNGTDTVTINGASNASYIGKTLIVNGYQRNIIGTPAGNKYQLDEAVADGTLTNSAVFPSFTIQDQRGILRIKQPDNITVEDLSLVELYKPQLNDNEEGYRNFYPFGFTLEIGNYGTASAYHAGTVQNQYQNSVNDPAIISVIQGDAYIRNRELPTNDVVPGTQLIVDHVIDPNFSDFYESNLSSLGLVVPQDEGLGRRLFGSRERFSNNFIQDTVLNGINDFDDLDRVDYNDPYGDIQLTKFRESRLFVFKYLKSGWAGVLQQRIESADGGGSLTTTQQLLSALNYFSWDGGIGDNPESYVSNGNFQYFASAGSGVFLRIGGDGIDPISQIYNYDKQSRYVLGIAAKLKLRIYGGFDRQNGEILWAIPAYNDYLYNGGFDQVNWNTYNSALPTGTTFAILQQPANSSVTLDSNSMFQLQVGNILGSDAFTYQATLPDGTVLPARRECFTVVAIPNRPQGFQPRASSVYCVTRSTGYQVRASTAYCLTRSTGFRGRTSSEYCLTRPIGIRPRASSAYCLQQASIPLAYFDFMVLRYIWVTGSGIDLDTFTGLINTGTAYDGNPTTRQGWVGYGQNPDPSTGTPDSGSRVIPYGSSTPYLNWGSDNTSGSGVEAILVDLKQFISDNPTTPNPVSVKMNTVWYNTKQSGNITVEVVTYKGGTMALDAPNHNFVNTGGVLVDQIDMPYNVSLQSRAYLITSSQATARMDFDKTTNTATLTLL